MINLEYTKAYEDKKVIKAECINVEEILRSGTDQDVIVAYGGLELASHYRDPSKPDGKRNGEEAWRKSRELIDEVRTRLEKAGWHAHIFKGGSGSECQCHVDLYLHDSLDKISVHQVPFSQEWNINLRNEELFNENESLRTKDETLRLLEERIGEETIDINQLVEDGEIEEEDAKTIKAIMEDADLEVLHELDVDNRTLRSGPESYEWMDSEEDAEERAKSYLEDDDYLWKQAVEAGNTQSGFQDWIDEVLKMDGWAQTICGYDGTAHYLEDGKVYWRSN